LFTQVFDTADIGASKTLTPSGTIEDDSNVDVTSNYNITFVPVNTGVITSLALTVTAVTDSKVYDGDNTSTALPNVTGSLAPGDVANFTQIFDTKNVGENKT